MPADITNARGTEHGIGQGVTQHVAIGMSERAALEWHGHAGQHQRAALHHPVKVVPRAHTRHERRLVTGAREVIRRRDFHVSIISFDNHHRQSSPFGQHRLVGRFLVPGAERNDLRHHVTTKSLRRLREPDLRPRHAFAHQAGAEVTALHRVPGHQRRNRRAGRHRRGEDPVDQRGRGEGSRCVVNQHHVGLARHRGGAQPHRVLAPRASGHDAARAPRRADQGRGGVDQRRRQHHHKLAHGRMGIAERHAVFEKRAPADFQQLLRPVGAHAGAMTSGHDDSGGVHPFILPFGRTDRSAVR